MKSDRDTGGKFLPGNSGRRQGSRNKLQAAFVDALRDDFEEHGADIIKIVRAEKPAEYLKILASILPKEMLLTENVLGDNLSDEQVLEYLEAIAVARKLETATTGKASH